MKIILSVAVSVSFLTLLGSADAQVNPNGFPSGAHYNLNIVGKKPTYQCTPLQVDELGNPVYGNVVFVPEDGQNVDILMKSGKTGGRASTITELRVTDACAGFDGDAAEIQLPPNEKGYRVYARALGKPSEENSLTISPNLVAVEDEYGNELIELGLVTDSGFSRTGETFTRTKGKSVAVDISGLFEWSGTICNIDWTFDWNLGVAPTNSATLCWTDNPLEGQIGFVDPMDDFSAPLADGTCVSGQSVVVPLICTTYTNEWVFNISDFVTYLWDLNNDRVKLLQVRFYPVQ